MIDVDRADYWITGRRGAINGEDRNERSLLRAIVLRSSPAEAHTAPEMVRIPAEFSRRDEVI